MPFSDTVDGAVLKSYGSFSQSRCRVIQGYTKLADTRRLWLGIAYSPSEATLFGSILDTPAVILTWGWVAMAPAPTLPLRAPK